jgi:hypothetical protein
MGLQEIWIDGGLNVPPEILGFHDRDDVIQKPEFEIRRDFGSRRLVGHSQGLTIVSSPRIAIDKGDVVCPESRFVPRSAFEP